MNNKVETHKGGNGGIDEKYNHLFADLEKVFYNLIIKKVENPEILEIWPESKRKVIQAKNPDIYNTTNMYERESFNNVLCDHILEPSLTNPFKKHTVAFTNDYYEGLIQEMCDKIINEDYLIYLLDVITRRINEKFYMDKQPYRLLYFYNNDTSEENVSTLTYEQTKVNEKGEEEIKRYGSFIKIPTEKEIDIPEENINKE
jgi:hypothetical protein